MFQQFHINYELNLDPDFNSFFSKVVIPNAKIYNSVLVQVVTKTFGTQKKKEIPRSTIHMRLAYLKMLLNHQMVNLVGYLNSVYICIVYNCTNYR